ncbi:extracellular catalytic domain type 2 short-chain-length polyhydroxyalkanoate depolymerase [Paraglaciecola polaris]|uniref:Poly (3-hydroxybutyrate) depolymerase n=1 Tax=Paraglaciecola polaris LMG 21857 TaxID=1129793 RepID=K7ABJ8_9ALTE|nr:PHB depolymerase family esterase [Paraglaciecola polaris]GAC32745.1 poly (3-hydroxybutyrate) depolymerase [Paraglaciecola polaris LMG 21857]|tara:strand:- start:17011 stop:18069 length:1059 start_codon:yes stop_codon:yes gene_type:complete
MTFSTTLLGKTYTCAALTLLLSATQTQLFAKEVANKDSLQVQYNVDLTYISLSGLSSGGYMATQFELAYSDWVSGVGIIAAGPYYCAQNSIQTALSQCVNQLKSPISLDVLSDKAIQWQEAGKLPSLSNLQQHKVWLLSGALDTKVLPQINQALYTQYQQWVKPENLTYVTDKPFAHLFPTLNSGTECDVSEAPFIGNCAYDAAGAMLTFIQGDLTPRNKTQSGRLIEIDQHKLGGKPAETLAKNGYLYVPQSCQQGESCTVHVSFHGCNQNASAVGDKYATQTGLNNWADTNNMLVLYPQTKSSMMMPLNPQGCWDWWGYTGEDYANQNGPQIKAVKHIIQALAKREIHHD